MGKFIITEDEKKRILNLYSLNSLFEATEHTQNLYKSWANNKSGNPELALSLMDDFFSLQKKLSKKDFTQYVSANELKNELDKIKDADQQKKNEKDVDVIHKDKNLLVVATKTWEAGCKYGSGTKWCTSAKDTSSYWKRHNLTGTEFIWILKNLPDTNPQHKVSLHFKDKGGHDWCNSINACSPKDPYSKNGIVIPNFDEIFAKCKEYSETRANDRDAENRNFQKQFMENNTQAFDRIKDTLSTIYNDDYAIADIFQRISEDIWDRLRFDDISPVALNDDGYEYVIDKLRDYFSDELMVDPQLKDNVTQKLLTYLLNDFTRNPNSINQYFSTQETLERNVLLDVSEIIYEETQDLLYDKLNYIVTNDPKLKKKKYLADDEEDYYY